MPCEPGGLGFRSVVRSCFVVATLSYNDNKIDNHDNQLKLNFLTDSGSVSS